VKHKKVVKGLGFTRLNQVIERPDTPAIRGMVAKVPHLVEIVEAVPKPAWTLVPEYTLYPPEAASSKPTETALEAPAVGTEKAEALVSPPRAPHVSLEDEPEAAATGDVTALPEKSGIERHAEILRSPGNDIAARSHGEGPPEADVSGNLAAPNISQPATPTGEGGASGAEEASPSEGEPKD